MKLHYDIKTTSIFEKQSKKLIKKYKSLKEELAGLILSLEENPAQGIPFSNHCFKIRISIKSKGKGKSEKTFDISKPFTEFWREHVSIVYVN
ncbi:MAG: hypothetical protein KBA66_05005 [Leptospiraceae bacterium]|nr:hypothetical protein [Leptospiraceae bacterium]